MSATLTHLSRLEATRADVDAAIAAIETAAEALAQAQATEQQLEDDRAEVKEAAILRLMQLPNQTTGKPHSASSAKDVVEFDEQYRAHRATQRAAVIATQRAWGQYEAAKRRADLALETFKLVGEAA